MSGKSLNHHSLLLAVRRCRGSQDSTWDSSGSSRDAHLYVLIEDDPQLLLTCVRGLARLVGWGCWLTCRCETLCAAPNSVVTRPTDRPPRASPQRAATAANTGTRRRPPPPPPPPAGPRCRADGQVGSARCHRAAGPGQG